MGELGYQVACGCEVWEESSPSRVFGSPSLLPETPQTTPAGQVLKQGDDAAQAPEEPYAQSAAAAVEGRQRTLSHRSLSFEDSRAAAADPEGVQHHAEDPIRRCGLCGSCAESMTTVTLSPSEEQVLTLSARVAQLEEQLAASEAAKEAAVRLANELIARLTVCEQELERALQEAGEASAARMMRRQLEARLACADARWEVSLQETQELGATLAIRERELEQALEEVGEAAAARMLRRHLESRLQRTEARWEAARKEADELSARLVVCEEELQKAIDEAGEAAAARMLRRHLESRLARAEAHLEETRLEAAEAKSRLAERESETQRAIEVAVEAAAADRIRLQTKLSVLEKGLAELCSCPLTLQPFYKPVLGSDGQTYERRAIRAWLRDKQTSPISRAPMHMFDLRGNRLAANLSEFYHREILNSTVEPDEDDDDSEDEYSEEIDSEADADEDNEEAVDFDLFG